MPRLLWDIMQSHEYLAASLSSSENLSQLSITGVSSCSNSCLDGFLFVAKKGATSLSRDGHDFIDHAISRGAKAVVVDSQGRIPTKLSVPVIVAEQSSRALSFLCEAFWDFPSKKLKLIGLTGTNGKTSTSFMLHSILRAAGFKPKIIGTLGIGDPGALSPLSHTTMEAEFISQALAELACKGASHVILESSSHGLALDRVTALDFAAVGLSNITHDHLDFHGSMSAYILAKQKLFEHVAKDHTFKILPEQNEFTKGVQGLPRTSFYNPALKPLGLALPGDFQVHNASLASAISMSLGFSPEHIALGLSLCPPIPGRLEEIKNEHCQIFVDFAHTPDALRSILNTMRKLTQGRVILVFGAGGNRDLHKRSLMGEVAQELADLVIITDDNPRLEDPMLIRAAIKAGMRGDCAKVHEIADRKEAIKAAILHARPEDLVLLAGKGHENYQIYGNERKFFSDQSAARQILESL